MNLVEGVRSGEAKLMVRYHRTLHVSSCYGISDTSFPYIKCFLHSKMQYKEYYQSASRHLYVCKTMMDTLDSMANKAHLTAKRQQLKLDIYYLSGYIIETMISYTFFVSINWQRNERVETCEHYNNGFKTHKLPLKITFAISKAHCDYSGVSLLGVRIKDLKEQQMFNEWSEVVRYQNPKTYSNLDFTETDLRKYLADIELMFNQLTKKFYS